MGVWRSGCLNVRTCSRVRDESETSKISMTLLDRAWLTTYSVEVADSKARPRGWKSDAPDQDGENVNGLMSFGPLT